MMAFLSMKILFVLIICVTLVLPLVSSQTPAPAPSDVVVSKVLLLWSGYQPSIATDLEYEFAVEMLNAHNAQYDIVSGISLATSPLVLESTATVNGNPVTTSLYSAVIMTKRTLQYTDANNVVVHPWTGQNESFLVSWMEKYGIRRLIAWDSPSSLNGLGFASTISQQGDEFTLKLLTAGVAVDSSFPSTWSHVMLDWESSYWVAKVLSNVGNAIVTPLISLTRKVDNSDNVGAVEYATSASSNTKDLILTFRMRISTGTSVPLFCMSWLTKGSYVGFRRVIFVHHIDDLFLSTKMWELSSKTTTGVEIRCNGVDLLKIKQAADAWSAALPSGSYIRLSIPFNGNGVFLNGGIGLYGDGSINNGGDSLFNYITSPSVRDSFYWVHHTFTHDSLDQIAGSTVPTPLRKVMWEIQENLYLAKQLFPNTKSFSGTVMVTPMITGLFNGEALAGLWATGVRASQGDNSVPALRSPTRYRGIWTTAAVHGFDGYFIIPRHATSIYYNAYAPSASMDQYNYIHSATETFQNMLAGEARVATQFLLNLRWDGYMFHQANIALYDGTNSLLSDWMTSVFTLYNQYSKLPVVSVSDDDHFKMWTDREVRDNCGSTILVLRTNNVPTSLLITWPANKSCKIGITGYTAAVGSPAGVSLESYGPDFTTWVVLPEGTVTQSITVPLSVNGVPAPLTSTQFYHPSVRAVGAQPIPAGKVPSFGRKGPLRLRAVILASSPQSCYAGGWVTNSAVSTATTFVSSIGMPYDIIYSTNYPLSSASFIYFDDPVLGGLYSLIVMTDRTLYYQAPSGNGSTCGAGIDTWTQYHQNIIHTYAVHYGVRIVTIRSFASSGDPHSYIESTNALN